MLPPPCRCADFVTEPARLFTASDVIVFSGSLNTLESSVFFRAVKTAYEAAVGELAFNFLSAARLAGADYLHWHRPAIVRDFLMELGGEVAVLEDYLDADCTIRVRKPEKTRT
jgi:hypothetical protein